MDKRHKKRIIYIQELYSFFFGKSKTISDTTKQILSNVKKIDGNIIKAAPKYAIDKIAKVDLSILRLAVYELVIEKKEPPKVIINEAVDLAHELGGEKSPAFVNAVLGLIYERHSHA